MKIDLHALSGARVTVMGLGIHGGGLASARFFAGRGARVTVTDLRSQRVLAEAMDQLREYDVRYVLERHEEEDFSGADLVIKNPAVAPSSPFLQRAREHVVPVETDLSVFFALARNPILAVTGSKGKSTTASAIAFVLSRVHAGTRLGGNITVSPLSFLDELSPDAPVVLELSSWQLGDLTGRGILKPAVSAFTVILPDHLDKYAGMADYVKDKKAIFLEQDPGQKAVFNLDDPWQRAFPSETRAAPFFFRDQSVSLVQFRCQDTRQDIAANKAAQTGQEPHPARQLPSQFARPEDLQTVVGRLKGIMGKGFNGDSAEQVMHDRIAHHHDVLQLSRPGLVRGEQILDQVADLLANDRFQPGLAAGNRKIYAAHDIRPMLGLGVEGGAHGEDIPRPQIHKLRDQGSRAEVHRDAQPIPGREGQLRLVTENGRFPLGQFQLEIALCRSAAGQAPTSVDLGWGEQPLVVVRHWQGTMEDLNPAAFAPPPSATGKLHPLRKQHVLERRAARDRQRRSHREELDLDALGHFRVAQAFCRGYLELVPKTPV